ncbi:MAG: hypothetical protein ABI707_20030, partial [Ferruginibacter sp.]
MRFTGLLFMILTMSAFSPETIFAQQKKLYIANGDHSDYVYTADEATYRTAYINQLDYYINLMETQNDTILPQFRHRYNCDNSLWVYEYEKAKSVVDFQRLIQKIKTGYITVPFNPLVPLYGGQNAEIALRGMYYGGYLERKYGIKIDIAQAVENQTLPLGINSLWAGVGAAYSWRGICGCGSPMANLSNRKNEVYYSNGRDGKGVLMKWYNFTGSGDLGGYAETAFPNNGITNLSAKCNTTQYPYSIAGAFCLGGDDLETYVNNLPTLAKQRSNT